MLCHHFDMFYIIVPDYGEVERFWELIDNAIMFFQDESGQIYEIQSSMVNRVEILHETGDEALDTTVAITDEKDVSELVAMYDTLQTKSTSRPLEVDRFILTFYQDDRALWRWWIAVSEDGRAIVTASSLRRGNYTVENSLDFDRFVELLNGQ